VLKTFTCKFASTEDEIVYKILFCEKKLENACIYVAHAVNYK